MAYIKWQHKLGSLIMGPITSYHFKHGLSNYQSIAMFVAKSIKSFSYLTFVIGIDYQPQK